MITTLQKMANSPVVTSHRAMTTLRWLGGFGLIVVFLLGLRATNLKQMRWEAAGEKVEFIKMVDATTNFGLVWMNDKGKIVRWNHGMTTLIGKNSKEMIGKSVADIPTATPEDHAIMQRIAKTKPSSWVASGPIRLKATSGKIVELRLDLVDVSDVVGSFRSITFKESPQALGALLKTPDSGEMLNGTKQSK